MRSDLPGKPGFEKPPRRSSEAHCKMALRFDSALMWWNLRPNTPATTDRCLPAHTRPLLSLRRQQKPKLLEMAAF